MGESGGEQVRKGHAPHHRTGKPRGNPRRETGHRRPVHRAVAATRHLVQAAQRETATRQAEVQFGKAKGKNARCPPAFALDPGDLRPEVSKG